jgi:hypothetical protein
MDRCHEQRLDDCAKSLDPVREPPDQDQVDQEDDREQVERTPRTLDLTATDLWQRRLGGGRLSEHAEPDDTRCGSA